MPTNHKKHKTINQCHAPTRVQQQQRQQQQYTTSTTHQCNSCIRRSYRCRPHPFSSCTSTSQCWSDVSSHTRIISIVSVVSSFSVLNVTHITISPALKLAWFTMGGLQIQYAVNFLSCFFVVWLLRRHLGTGGGSHMCIFDVCYDMQY